MHRKGFYLIFGVVAVICIVGTLTMTADRGISFAFLRDATPLGSGVGQNNDGTVCEQRRYGLDEDFSSVAAKANGELLKNAYRLAHHDAKRIEWEERSEHTVLSIWRTSYGSNTSRKGIEVYYVRYLSDSLWTRLKLRFSTYCDY
jgi:hypothetical protein